MITAKIIKDSISPVGKRITTFELEYPRMVHAEALTHRVFSRNAASSRAIPIETMIQMVMDNPAIPVWWGKNQAGMQAKEELNDTIWNIPCSWTEQGNQIHRLRKDSDEFYEFSEFVTEREAAKRTWLHGRNVAVQTVKALSNLKLHKQIANRVLEPWSHIKVVVTSTEWDNWYNLRDHMDAQPEIRVLAEIMLELHNNSIPEPLGYGQWHLPYVEDKVIYDEFDPNENSHYMDWLILARDKLQPGEILLDDAKKLSVSLCAQVSYRKSDDSLLKAINIYDRLITSKPSHASPVEHQATPFEDVNKTSGNFRGWLQNRQLIKDNNCSNYPKFKKTFGLN